MTDETKVSIIRGFMILAIIGTCVASLLCTP